jgi:hypothetical protein
VFLIFNREQAQEKFHALVHKMRGNCSTPRLVQPS